MKTTREILEQALIDRGARLEIDLLKKAIAEEREACALVAIAALNDPTLYFNTPKGPQCDGHTPGIIADRIRARTDRSGI